MASRKSFCPLGAIAAIIAMGTGACAGDRRVDPAVSAYRFPVREYTFPSGLRVVIEQDDTTPIAGVVWVVEAGHLDDPPGKSHLAHLVEHLIPEAPMNGGASLRTVMRRLGAVGYRATTDVEQTTYPAFVSLTSLDELLRLLTARMADPTAGIDDALVATHLRVVAEEMRTRRDASGGGETVFPILFSDDPVARLFAAPIQADALTQADVRSFADRIYRPERMTLVISGAIRPDWDDRLKALLPPKLRGRDAERQAPVRRPAGVAAPRLASNQMPTLKAGVLGPELWMAWPLPAATRLQSLRFTVLERVADRILTESFDRDAAGVMDFAVGPFKGQEGALLFRARLRSATDAERARKEITTAMASLSGTKAFMFEREFSGSYRRTVREMGLYTALSMQSLPARALARAEVAHRAAGTSLSDIITSVLSLSVDDVGDWPIGTCNPPPHVPCWCFLTAPLPTVPPATASA